MSGEILLSLSYSEEAGPYLEALRAGGVPAEQVRIVRPDEDAECRALAIRAQAIVLGGGPDVEPWRYDEEPDPEAGLRLRPELDAVEWELLAGAREGRVPVWGICRGLQVLNVYFGGSLFQDLGRRGNGSVNHNLRQPKDATPHTVAVGGARTVLADLLDREPVPVNSRHHQGIRRLAPGLVTVATSPDGLIEAVSWSEADWWVHAVQWHPENLVHLAQHRALWEAFARAIGLSAR